MNVSGLSRDNVASHLQKHRLGLKRGRTRKRRTDSAPPAKPKSRRKGGHASEAGALTAGGSEDQRAADADNLADGNGASAAAVGAAGYADFECLDQAGSNEQEREGSNPRNNDGSCDRGEGNNGSNGRTSGRYDHIGERSDDGVGAGSDNRNSACIENAHALAAQLDKPAKYHGDGAVSGEAGAGAPAHAPSPPAQPSPLDQSRFGSGAGSNGDKGSGNAQPRSAVCGSRVGSSRATMGSAANNVNATADVGSRQVAAAPVAAEPAAPRQVVGAMNALHVPDGSRPLAQ